MGELGSARLPKRCVASDAGSSTEVVRRIVPHRQIREGELVSAEIVSTATPNCRFRSGCTDRALCSEAGHCSGSPRVEAKSSNLRVSAVLLNSAKHWAIHLGDSVYLQRAEVTRATEDGLSRLESVVIALCERVAASEVETPTVPDPKGLAVIRAAQLDLAAKTLDRHDCHSLGEACTEAAVLLRSFAGVAGVKTSPPSCTDCGDSGIVHYDDGHGEPRNAQCPCPAGTRNSPHE
jgi:hypothetical protein